MTYRNASKPTDDGSWDFEPDCGALMYGRRGRYPAGSLGPSGWKGMLDNWSSLVGSPGDPLVFRESEVLAAVCRFLVACGCQVGSGTLRVVADYLDGDDDQCEESLT